MKFTDREGHFKIASIWNRLDYSKWTNITDYMVQFGFTSYSTDMNDLKTPVQQKLVTSGSHGIRVSKQTIYIDMQLPQFQMFVPP